MTEQLARVSTDPGEVVRQVRGMTGIPWRRLLGYLRPQAGRFIVAVVALLLSSAIGLLVPLVVAGIATQVVAGGDPAGLDRLVLILVGIALATALFGFVETALLGIIGERIVAALRGQLFDRLVTLSLDFHARARLGDLVSRLSSDVTQVRTMLTQTITGLLTSLVGLVGSVLILLVLSPALLLLALVVVPALFGVAIVFGRPLQRASAQVQDQIAESTATAEEALGGIRVVKSFVREDWEQARYARDLRRIVAAATRLALWRGGFGALMTFLGFATVALLLWFTGHQVIEGVIPIGTLTSFLLYGISIAANLGGIASGYGQFREGAGCRVAGVRAPRHPADHRRSRAGAGHAPGPRRDRVRRRLVRLRAGARDPPGDRPRDRRRRGDRAGRAVGRRQDHPDQPRPAPLGRQRGRDPHRRARHPLGGRAQPARADRPRAAGGDPVRRVDPRQHPVRAPRRERGRDDRGRAGRPTRTTS